MSTLFTTISRLFRDPIKLAKLVTYSIKLPTYSSKHCRGIISLFRCLTDLSELFTCFIGLSKLSTKLIVKLFTYSSNHLVDHSMIVGCLAEFLLLPNYFVEFPILPIKLYAKLFTKLSIELCSKISMHNANMSMSGSSFPIITKLGLNSATALMISLNAHGIHLIHHLVEFHSLLVSTRQSWYQSDMLPSNP
ncbi:hypothetical protein LR48_Vigan02g059200 [Vigna angularis]|uniref:Uncharacterized protein n=1 Tax=Phaseolus angularis TaxID=3914 RepID=A0A0L9TVM8_PHAAN|nr:hypothetical protein LR48_Vigan02g059200 [Vigna angularis]